MKKKIFTEMSLPCRYGKRMLAYMALAIASVGFASAQEWIDVTNVYMKDASFSSGKSDFWADGTLAPGVSDRFFNAEYYQKRGTAAQYIYASPGEYKLTVRGYHRASGNDNGAAYEAETEEIKAYLFAGDDQQTQIPLASLYSAPKNMLGEGSTNTRNGWPDGMESMVLWCEANADIYVNELEFTVTEVGKLLVGINSETNGGGSWTCWDDFKLYVYGTQITPLKSQIIQLENLREELTTIGVTAASEFTAFIDKYAEYTDETPDDDISAGMTEMAIQIGNGNVVLKNCSDLTESIQKAEELLAECEDGTYPYATDLLKNNLRTAIATAKAVMGDSSMEELVGSSEQAVKDINEVIANTKNVIGMSYPLVAAKALADKIGNLEGSAEYQKVVADLNATELSLDDVILDVQALNQVCKDNMDAAFLGAASDENPIDLTSFIVNPNIYQAGSSKENPAGWICDLGGADDGNVTNGEGDVDLNCYSWSGNEARQIGKSHYWQKIGGDDEGAVSLPDGLYVVKAATFTYNDLEKETPEGNEKVIQLFASTDSVNFSLANTNADREAYDEARKELGTTTEVANVEVRNGVLYLGIKGKYIGTTGQWIGGNGRYWNADNFRLYYVNASALTAYRERLQDRVDKGVALHNELAEYEIDDEILTLVLGEDSLLVTSEDTNEIRIAIEGLDELLAMGAVIIENYKALSSLVTTGEEMNTQLINGLIAAQPTAKAHFEIALEAAEIVYGDLEWENMYYNTKEVTAGLEEALTVLKASVAICYPLIKAKLLADRIGGMSDNSAYKQVLSDLKNDDLEQMDADLDVFELNSECAEAMTSAVLATASPENPFDMTSFIANPNIYQNKDAFDADELNGWSYEGIWGQGRRDSPHMTGAEEGDTWLNCYSWSGNDRNNCGLGNNYYQIVGLNGEGTIALPNGTYRVSAATYSDAAKQIDLYAVTRESYLIGDSVAYRDSTEYVNTINDDQEAWELAQATVGTTTDIFEVYVRNGSLCIGVKGNSVVSGNGRSWVADNFRLYLISADEITDPDSVDETLVDGNAQPEFVDVYDLTGRLIRSQVKATNAVEGLKKGFYIVGGKKQIVK